MTSQELSRSLSLDLNTIFHRDDHTPYTPKADIIETPHHSTILSVQHNFGFFSCCSVILSKVVKHINNLGSLPVALETSKCLLWYKPAKSKTWDTRLLFFDCLRPQDVSSDLERQLQSVKFHHNDQYQWFDQLDYDALKLLVQLYFTPCASVKVIQNGLEYKYHLDYSNTCVLFYRGNDKSTEMKLSSYESFFAQADDVLQKHTTVNDGLEDFPNKPLTFLIQSDETEFIQAAQARFGNHVVFWDEIRHMPKQNSTVDWMKPELNFFYALNFLAITQIMSQCQYVICPSGNCSLWIMLYRGHCKNVRQCSNDQWKAFD